MRNVFFYTESMIYFAHRGASGLRPQNTLSAFALARELGATAYELDVHLTRDKWTVIHHDYSLKDTTGTDVQIKDLTLSQLQKYPLINRFSGDVCTVPTLRDVLPVIQEELQILNIEIKNDGNLYPGIEKALLENLQLYAPELLPKLLISSFDYETLVRVRKLNKNVKIGHLCRQFDLAKTLALGAVSLHMNHTRITPQIIAACRQNGLKVFVYTVNDLSLAKTLQAQGVDGIFTDRVDLFVKNRKAIFLNGLYVNKKPGC